MQKTILQIPLTRQLKDEAEKAAYEQGFSSLQEILRVFMKKLAGNKISLSINETVYLSEKNEKRYLEITKDFEKDKNVSKASNTDDLIKQLRKPL